VSLFLREGGGEGGSIDFQKKILLGGKKGKGSEKGEGSGEGKIGKGGRPPNILA